MSHVPSSRRAAAAAFFISLTMAGCSANSIAPSSPGTTGTDASRSPSQIRALADGQGARPNASHASSRGWMSPEAKTDKNVLYWGDYDSNTITIYSSKGVNGKQLGQITTGLSGPERLFVDKNGSLYASNIGNGTITAYKLGAKSPFLTISTGVDGPTGLTVDAAGTVYVANVNGENITEYPKGKTSPSVTIATPGSPEYLATDANDNLYASIGTYVYEYAKGKTTGANLNLTIGAAGALEVNSKGNLIVLDTNTNDADYFPAGQTSPSKEVPLGGFPFGFALSKNEKTLYVSNSEGASFEIQSLAYPNGKAPKTKVAASNGNDWPLAISPDTVLGK